VQRIDLAAALMAILCEHALGEIHLTQISFCRRDSPSMALSIEAPPGGC
jgi:hypothetical protein